ncbi:LysR substrate-binding domain-containing protein [[Clostridium] dakarense]|uniref:LysR substrate-binding domain-containing protein n=1 Tax=Faecalimicrobium dakarense TaxID=1301100 RepID=UPI0004B93F79|nr:LysR substrate-binding domain-containing protein [[Clostridium] dakarense]
MLDFRLETFIQLCESKNYTKTAKKLCITQPAVTQHIKYIESKYNVKLFQYVGKSLTLTKAGEVFLNNMLHLKTMSNAIENNIKTLNSNNKSLSFGATRTIGEFIVPNIVKKYISEFPSTNLSVVVDNTSTLLDMLKKGLIEFALVEGHFNKSEYETYLFSKEEFVVVTSPDNELTNKPHVNIDDLLDSRLIIREKGSGTREIFEMWLYEHNYSYENFNHFIELGNINLIKDLVKDNLGISLMYKKAIEKEINNKELVFIDIDNFDLYHEFNFIFLKDSIFKDDYVDFYNSIK